MFDLILKDGEICDTTGNEPCLGDGAVEAGRIAAVCSHKAIRAVSPWYAEKADHSRRHSFGEYHDALDQTDPRVNGMAFVGHRRRDASGIADVLVNGRRRCATAHLRGRSRQTSCGTLRPGPRAAATSPNRSESFLKREKDHA